MKDIKDILCLNTRYAIQDKYKKLETKRQCDKSYREVHKDELREKTREYRNEHFDCICGGKYSRKSKARHEICNKHVMYLNNINASIPVFSEDNQEAHST